MGARSKITRIQTTNFLYEIYEDQDLWWKGNLMLGGGFFQPENFIAVLLHVKNKTLAIDLLDRKPLDQLDEREQRLLNLALSFGHIALAVEIQGPDEAQHAELRKYMRITRSPADALA